MLATPTRDPGIISLPEVEDATATLTRADSTTYLFDQDSIDKAMFVYRVNYLVNPSKALKNGSTTVEIIVSSKAPGTDPVRTFDTSNPQALVRNLLLRTQQQKDSIRAAKQTRLLTYKSDFTKFIPNNLVPQLRQSIRKPVLQTKQTVVTKLVSELTTENKLEPVIEINRNLYSQTSAVDNATLRKVSNELLYESGLDPASIAGSKTNTIVPAKHMLAGTIPAKKNVANNISSNNSGVELLTNSLLSTTTVENQLQVTENSYITTFETTTSDSWITVSETLSIPQQKLAGLSSFYLIFKIKNSRGVTLQTVWKPINHQAQLGVLRLPVTPPVIRTQKIGSFGQNVIQAKQIDPHGTSIRLYRKTTSSTQTNKGSAAYTLVGEMKAEKGDDYVRFVDFYSSTQPTIYRAVSVNADGNMSCEFSSMVVRTARGPVAKTSSTQNLSRFVSISSEIQTTAIVLTLSKLPSSGPVAFRVLRRDITLKSEESTMIGDVTLIESSGVDSINIVDTSPKLGRIYEYRVQLIHASGKVDDSSTVHLVRFEPVTANIMSIVVTPPAIEQNGANVDVTFEISKEIIENSADRIKALLNQQGFIGEFQDEIIADRSRLGNIFAITVKRHNLTTGETEDFGVVTSETFSDRALGNARGVSSLEPGNEYKYTLTAFARNIETLLPTLEKSDTTKPSLAYSYLPSEWLHPLTLSEGSIVSQSSLNRNHSRNDLTFGEVSDIKEFTVSLAETLPSIYDGKASLLDNKSIALRWKVQGSITKIDHFLIVLDILGMRTVVGKAHNISSTNSLQFIDKLENGESGGLVYLIIPVYYDYSRGPEFKTNVVVV